MGQHRSACMSIKAHRAWRNPAPSTPTAPRPRARASVPAATRGLPSVLVVVAWRPLAPPACVLTQKQSTPSANTRKHQPQGRPLGELPGMRTRPTCGPSSRPTPCWARRWGRLPLRQVPASTRCSRTRRLRRLGTCLPATRRQEGRTGHCVQGCCNPR